ncbi:MAG: Mut7-C RNAse domain-containing protein [Planctomycetota bacterium]|jgi:uncharacterized protein with PIN domain
MPEELTFLCDAMLGGLARWLRAAGHRALFDVHARDGALVRRALEEGRCLLTSDSGIMERYAVAQGIVRCVFVPRGLSPLEQLAHVMAALDLPLRQPRCMDCGGRLADVPLEEVAEQVPRKVQKVCSRFFRCDGCCKVYWRGTHWESIRRQLGRARQLAGAHRGRAGPCGR